MSYIKSDVLQTVEVDLSAQANQTFSANGDYTIASRTWTKINTANEAAAAAIVNGSGLVIQPASSTDYNAGTRTLPGMEIRLSALFSQFSVRMGVRLWLYSTANNSAANYDGAHTVIDCGSQTAFMCKRSYAAGGVLGLNVNKNSAFNQGPEISASIGAANNVAVLEVPSLLHHQGHVYYGTWSSGFPALSTLTALDRYDPGTSASRRTDGTTGLDPAQWRILLGAKRAGSGTSLSVTYAYMRVEFLQ